MGFGIGSLIEKVCDKLGANEDWGDALGFVADGAAIGGLAIFGAPVASGTMGGIIVSALVTGSLADGFENADDLVEDWGEDPLTASAWKDRIRADGYESFEAAVRNGEVSDAVMKDPGMQSLRAEHEEEQQGYRDGLASMSAIEAARTASLRG